MKYLASFLVFLFSYGNMMAQPASLNPKWFFGFTLDNAPRDIHSLLGADSRFKQVANLKIKRADSTSIAYIYAGSIVHPCIDENYCVDSASLFLTAGRSTEDENVLYSGFVKILKCEYFSQDSSVINRLYDLSTMEYSIGIDPDNVTEVDGSELTVKKQGIWINYVNEADQYRKIEIWRSYEASIGVYSLLLEETYSDKQ